MPATRSPPGGPGDAAPDDLLPHRLTDALRRAVSHTGGPLLVVAGPGAGKTSVMVRRAAWLVLEHGVDPGSLLVTTFTNEAAEELFDRLHRFLGARTNDVHISTLHSFCRTVLEDHPEAHAWGPGFRVLDAREQFLLVQEPDREPWMRAHRALARRRKGTRRKAMPHRTSSTTRDAACVRDRPVPGGLRRRRGICGVCAPPRCAEGIAVVALPCICPGGARNARPQGSRSGSQGRLKQLGLSEFPKSRKGDFIQDVLSAFNLCTEEQVPPDLLVAALEARGPALLGLEEDAPGAVEEYRAVAEAYGRYRELLREEGLLDFSTLQSVAWGILYDEELHDNTGEGEEQGPSGAGGRDGGKYAPGPTLPLDGRDPDRADARREARRELRARFRHLLVDEYQDTNRLQVEILRSLARPDDRITAVGDDDQSIYGFRGASPSSFLRFERDFPGAETVRLRTNFRSTPPLVEAATRLIDHNAPERREKELEPHRRQPELPPAVVHRETSPEEAEAVVETLADWKERGLIGGWSEVTLLFRSVKSYAGPYLEAMAERGIPFEVAADGAFFDRDDVEQMKRLFTFCGWKRRWRTEALAGPVIGLSPRTLEALHEWEGDPVEWTDPEVLDEVGVGDERERRVLAGRDDP